MPEYYETIVIDQPGVNLADDVIEEPRVAGALRRVARSPARVDSFVLLEKYKAKMTRRHYGPGDHPSGSPQSEHGGNGAGYEIDFPKVSPGDLVDGRVVLESVPNRESISASLNEFEIMPGIREVKFSDFPLMREAVYFYSKSERERTERLAELIREKGKVSPLIVVLDSEGLYVLEGSHRFDALRILGAGSFPALVVVDLESVKGELRSKSLRVEYPATDPAVENSPVLYHAPGADLLSTSTGEYKVLSGIRRVKFSDFPGIGPKDSPIFQSRNEREQTELLAMTIHYAGSINPLVVAIDKEGPSVLDGERRFNALRLLQVESFPAVILISTELVPDGIEPPKSYLIINQPAGRRPRKPKWPIPENVG